MCNETEKAYERRAKLGWFDKYLVGSGIDIGCGYDKLKSMYQVGVHLRQYALTPNSINPEIRYVDYGRPFECRGWEVQDGDAQYMKGIDDCTFDFVYSSHCLEHMVDPSVAMSNWWRILKPGGFLVVVVPDEDLYEQGVWPSRGNGDHKTTWTVYKAPGVSWSPVSRNLADEVAKLVGYEHLTVGTGIKVSKFVKHLEQVDTNYDYELAKTGWHDQTGPVINGTEAAVEAIVQKPFGGK